MSNKKEKATSEANYNQALNTQQQNVAAIQLPPVVQKLMDAAGQRLDQYNNKDYSGLPLVSALVQRAQANRAMKRTPLGAEALAAGGANSNYVTKVNSEQNRIEDQALGGDVVNAIDQQHMEDTNTALGAGSQAIGAESARAGAGQGILSDTQQQYQFARRPSFLSQLALSLAGGASQGLGAVLTAGATTTKKSGCWVAAEIFGGWDMPKTVAARWYVNNDAPVWFRELYMDYGEWFAGWLKGHSLIKKLVRPLFEYFAWRGRR